MTVTVHGYIFHIRYGYYEESDREYGEPVAVYPDLKSEPVYSAEGYPLVTAIQQPCEYYTVHSGREKEDCCSDCIHYPNSRDEIGICKCEDRRIKENVTVDNKSEEGKK